MRIRYKVLKEYSKQTIKIIREEWVYMKCGETLSQHLQLFKTVLESTSTEVTVR